MSSSNPFVDMEASVSRNKKHRKDEEEEPEEEDEEEEEEEEIAPKKRKSSGNKRSKRSRRRASGSEDDDDESADDSFVVPDGDVRYASEDEIGRLEKLAEQRRQRDRAKIHNRKFARHESDEDDDDTDSYKDDDEGDSEDDDDSGSDSDAPDDAPRRRRSNKSSARPSKSKRRKGEGAASSSKAASSEKKSKVRSRPRMSAVARIRASMQTNKSDPVSLKRRTEQLLSKNADDATELPTEKTERTKATEKVDTNVWSGCVAWLREQMKLRAKEKGLAPPAADAPLEWMDHDQIYVVDTVALDGRVPVVMPQTTLTKGSSSFIFNVGKSLVPLKTKGVLSGKEVEQQWDAIYRGGGQSPLMLPLVTRTSAALLQTVPPDTPKEETLPMAGVWWALQCLCVFGAVSRKSEEKSDDGSVYVLYDRLNKDPAWKSYMDGLKAAPMLTPVKPWPKEPESCVRAWLKLIAWTVRNIAERKNRLTTGGVCVNFVPTQILLGWMSKSVDELARRTTHLGLKQRALAAKQSKSKGAAAEAEASADWVADAWGEIEAVPDGTETKKSAKEEEAKPTRAIKPPPVNKETKPLAKTKKGGPDGALNALAGRVDSQQRVLTDWTAQADGADSSAKKAKVATASAETPAKKRAVEENGHAETPPVLSDSSLVVSWAQLTAALGADGVQWLRSRMNGDRPQQLDVPPALRRQVLVDYMVRKWGQPMAEYVVAAATAMTAVPRFLSEQKAVSLDDIRRLLPELFATAVSESTEKAALHADGDVAAWRSMTLPDELVPGASALDPEADAAALRRVLLTSGASAAVLDAGAAPPSDAAALSTKNA